MTIRHKRVRNPIEVQRNRDWICDLCAQSPKSVSELVRLTGMTPGAVQSHLRVLRRGEPRRLRICAYAVGPTQKRIAMFMAILRAEDDAPDLPRPPAKQKSKCRREQNDAESIRDIPVLLSAPHAPIMQAFYGLPAWASMPRDPGRSRFVVQQ